MREQGPCFPRLEGTGSFPRRVPLTRLTPEKRCHRLNGTGRDNYGISKLYSYYKVGCIRGSLKIPLLSLDSGAGSRWEMWAQLRFPFRWQHNGEGDEMLRLFKIWINVWILDLICIHKQKWLFFPSLSRWEIFAWAWDSPHCPIWTRGEFYWEELTYSAAT